MMKLIPSIGLAFVKEDKRDFGDSAIDIPEEMLKGVGTQGKIVWVTNDPEWRDQYVEGERIVFSRYNEQICIYENGKETILYSVPVQSINGRIVEE